MRGGPPLGPLLGVPRQGLLCTRRWFFLPGESQHVLGDELWFQLLPQTPDGPASPGRPSAVPLGVAGEDTARRSL